MDRLPNIHPGEILQRDFLEPLGITSYRLAKAIGVGQIRLSEIVSGKRAVRPDTALRLARYFGTSAELWIGLQRQHDLEEVRLLNASMYENITPLAELTKVAQAPSPFTSCTPNAITLFPANTAGFAPQTCRFS